MIAAFGRHAGQTLGWAIAIFILVLPALLGSLASVAAVLLSLLLLPVLIYPQAWPSLARQPAMPIFAAVFAALVACYGLTARDPGNLLFALNFLALPLAPLLYLLARRVRDPVEAIVLLSTLCAVGVAICALVALNDVFLRGLPRATGFIMGGNLLARIALVLGFLSLAGVLAGRSRFRFALFAGPVLAFVVVLLTGTRGAALAIPAMIAVYAGFLLANRGSRLQLLVLAAIGLAFAAAVVLSGRMGSIVSVIGEVLSTGSAGADSAANERLAMLGAAFEAFKASPWIGYGWANFGPAAAPFMDMVPHGGPTGTGFQFHNDLANFAVAAGTVGILCWVALLAAPIIGALATPRDSLFRVRLHCCLQLSVGYAIFGLTDFTFGYDLPTTLYAFLTAMVLGATGEERAVAQPAL